MQRYRHAIFLVLAIGSSLWNPDCFAQGNAATAEGTCSADDPDTCQNSNPGVDVTDASDSQCQDDNGKCPEWATIGECDNNPGYMLHFCRRSCLQCPDQAAELQKMIDEKRKNIKTWTEQELHFGVDMGVKQNLENADFGVSIEEGIARIKTSRAHLHSGNTSDDIIDICKNDHEDCTTW